MSKKALSIIVLLGIVLSACGGQAAQATETPTAVPETATTVPATNTATEETIPVTGETEATETATPSVTPTVFVPENAADCTNLASFVSDVTIPDNSTVNAGETFTKTWRVQNTGTCIWWAGYTLTHYSENAMSAPASVPLPVTNPGESADISVDLIAPSVAGTYRGNFVIENPDGLIMQVDEDSRLWLIINVTGTAPTASTGTPDSSSSGGSGTPAPTTASGSSSSNSARSAGATCAFTTDAGRTNAAVNALNVYRAQNGLATLPVNPRLSQAAQAHANDMACNNLFVHTGSDGSTPETRVVASGYSASDVSENVYGSYPPLTGEGAVSWWAADQTDPRHNENLLTTKYTEIGLGYAFYENFGYYVIVFATP